MPAAAIANARLTDGDRVAFVNVPDLLDALRPGREAQVMRQRLEKHTGRFPAAAVFRMWREMMSAFTLMQTPELKIAICRPHDQPGYWDLARDHFGCQIPLVPHDTPAQVLAAVTGSARVATGCNSQPLGAMRYRAVATPDFNVQTQEDLLGTISTVSAATGALRSFLDVLRNATWS